MSPQRRVVVGLIALLAVVSAGFVVSPAAALATVEAMAADPIRFGALVGILYVIRPVFAWPTTPLAIVVGYGFGVTLGVPIALAGIVLTVIPPFLAARWIAAGADPGSCRSLPVGDAVERAGKTLVRYYDTTGSVRGVAVTRLAPIPSDVATAAAAVSGVRLGPFLAGTVVGEVPWTVAAVVVGASAATITTDGLGELGVPLLVGCLVAAVALLAGPLYRVTTDTHGGLAADPHRR